jgi:hypothetical protein
MLTEFLEKALATGGDSIEIEYKDGKEWVTACRDCVGFGIGALDREEAKRMFKEMDDLKKKKEVTIGGVKYRLAFSRYESFGEVGPPDPDKTNASYACSQATSRLMQQSTTPHSATNQ